MSFVSSPSLNATGLPVGLHSERRRRALVPVALCLAASVGALALVGPRLFELRDSVLGLGGDPYQTLWRFSAFAEAVSRRTLVIQGEPFRNFAPLPWLPLHVLFGEPLGYNLVWLLQFPLTALAAYGLARFLGIPRASAALAGLLAAYAPTRIAQSLGHFGAMQVFWIPLTLLALLWLLRRPSLLRTLLAAAAFVGASWTEHVLFLTTLVAALLAVAVFRHQAARMLQTRRGVLLGMLLCLLVGALGVLPFRAELQDTARSDSSLNPGTAQRLRFAPTANTTLAVPVFHRFARSANPYGTPRDAVADRVHALGLLAPVLAVLGLRTLWRDGRRQPLALLGSLVAIGLLLALAPRTSLGAQVYNELPIVAAVRTVNRFLALPALAVPLLASIGVSRLPRNVWGVLAALLLLEILPAPFPTQGAMIPGIYRTLAPGPAGPVLEIPAATDYLAASRAQYVSAAHQRRVLASNAFERVQDREERVAPLRVPVVGALLTVRPEEFERPTIFGQLPADIAHAALASEQVRAVILRERVVGLPTLRTGPQGPVAVPPETFRALHRFLRLLGLRAENAGDDATIYRVPPWPGDVPAVVVVPGAGWRTTQSGGASKLLRVRHGMSFSVRVLGNNAVPVTLSFRIHGEKPERIQLAGPAEPIQVVESPDGTVSFGLGTLAPGSHTFSFVVDGSEFFMETPSVRKSLP